jgi:hypothetical protein
MTLTHLYPPAHDLVECRERFLVALDKFLARWAQRWLETHPAVKRTAVAGTTLGALALLKGSKSR